MNTPELLLFDTHRFVKRMTEAGMPLGQAETLAEQHATLLNDNRTPPRDIEELKGSVSGLEGDTSELKGDVRVLKADVSELKDDVRVLKVDVSELKGDVAGLKVDVGELKRDVSDLKKDVGGLQRGTAVLQTKVTMIQWVVGGIGFGMALLLVRSFGVI